MKKLFIPSIILLFFIITTFVLVITINNGKKTEIVITNEEVIYEENLIKSNNNVKSEEEIINDLFEDKVLNYECEIRGVELDENTLIQIKKKTQEDLTEEELEKIADRNLTEQEFREELLIKLIDMEKRVILKEQLMEEISDNKIEINDKKFKKKVEEFNNNKQSMSFEETANTLYSLLNQYIEILKNQYTKNVINVN